MCQLASLPLCPVLLELGHAQPERDLIHIKKNIIIGTSHSTKIFLEMDGLQGHLCLWPFRWVLFPS